MASKATWKKKIKNACIEAGTYQPFFDLAIDQLASIMARRDMAKKLYDDTHAEPLLNLKEHPALAMITKYDKEALAYWRDLGLTPAGFKKLGNDALKKDQGSFESMLAGIGL